MKKIIIFVFMTVVFALPASADMGTDFRDHFQAGALADYNRDVSAMIGLADLHIGQSATFPAFSVGASVSAIKTSSDNFSSQDYFYVPYVTAQTQLPFFNLGVALRGTTYDGFNSIGMGVKWNKSLLFFDLNASVFYDRYNTDYYDGDHFSVSTVASVSLLAFTPYVGVGYDYSGIKTKNMGLSASSYDGAARCSVGVSFAPIPFVHAYGAYTVSEYNQGFQGGLGVSF